MLGYLSASEFIDSDHPAVVTQAKLLANGKSGDIEIARSCFEFVRDQIRHTGDVGSGVITCKASDVLKARTGYCYAKSHLLVALLRANKIPAGLCYQRLTIEGEVPPYCLHGLAAVHLDAYGWYRIDPRGNKPGVDAQFMPPCERLAFPIVVDGEMDLPEIWQEPLSIVSSILNASPSVEFVAANLPDIELLTLTASEK